MWKGAGTLGTWRDATSASTFSVPATWNTAGGADREVRWRIAKPFRSRNEMGEALRDAIRVVHATAGELSDPMAV